MVLAPVLVRRYAVNLSRKLSDSQVLSPRASGVLYAPMEAICDQKNAEMNTTRGSVHDPKGRSRNPAMWIEVAERRRRTIGPTL